jgi:hypothetical protein
MTTDKQYFIANVGNTKCYTSNMIRKPVAQCEQTHFPDLAVENAQLKHQLAVSQAESRRLKRLLRINLDPDEPAGIAGNLV